MTNVTFAYTLLALLISIYTQAQELSCTDSLDRPQNISENELLHHLKNQIHFDLKYTNATASRWLQCWNSEDKTFDFKYPELKEPFKKYCNRTRVKISGFFENEWPQMRQALALNKSSNGALVSGDSQVLSPREYLPESLPETEHESKNFSYYSNSVVAQDITHQLSGLHNLKPMSKEETIEAFKILNKKQDDFYRIQFKIEPSENLRDQIQKKLKSLTPQEKAKLQYKKDLQFKNNQWTDQYLGALKKAPVLAFHGPDSVSSESINQALQRFHYSSFQQLRKFELKKETETLSDLASSYPLVFERILKKHPEFCSLGQKILKQTSTWNTVKNIGILTTMMGTAFYLCRASVTLPQKLFGTLALTSTDVAMLANTTSEYEETQKKAFNQIDGTQDLVSLNQMDQLDFEKKMALLLLPMNALPLMKLGK